jgi:hypothetical protein
MKKPQEIKVCFIQADEMGITKLQVVQFHTYAGSGPETLQHLSKGLTAWAQETDEGKDAWDNSSSSFNISDLLACVDQNGTPIESLRPYFEKEGILRVKNLFLVTDTDQVNYDRILAAPSEL